MSKQRSAVVVLTLLLVAVGVGLTIWFTGLANKKGDDRKPEVEDLRARRAKVAEFYERWQARVGSLPERSKERVVVPLLYPADAKAAPAKTIAEEETKVKALLDDLKTAEAALPDLEKEAARYMEPKEFETFKPLIDEAREGIPQLQEKVKELLGVWKRYPKVAKFYERWQRVESLPKRLDECAIQAKLIPLDFPAATKPAALKTIEAEEKKLAAILADWATVEEILDDLEKEGAESLQPKEFKALKPQFKEAKGRIPQAKQKTKELLGFWNRYRKAAKLPANPEAPNK
jgi:hypothetical protein